MNSANETEEYIDESEKYIDESEDPYAYQRWKENIDFILASIAAVLLAVVLIGVVVSAVKTIIRIPERVYKAEYTFVVSDNDYTDNYVKSSDATQDIYFKAYAVYNDDGKTVKYGEVSVRQYSEFTNKYMKSIKNKQECKDMMEHNKPFVCQYKFGNKMTIFIPDDEYDSIVDKLSNGETKIKGGSLN